MRICLSCSTIKGHEASPKKETRHGGKLQAHQRNRNVLERSNQLNNELLTMVESEVLGWSGASKETVRGGQSGFWVLPFTVYRFVRRTLGHVHHNGVADLTFPREIRDELIDGRAKPHGAGLAGVVSYHIRELEDVPECAEPFRMNYERASASAERRRKA